MSETEFIDWIQGLGFNKTWETYEGEYSMFPGDFNVSTIFGPKVYFVIESGDVNIYYSDYQNNMQVGTTIGRFPVSQIGDFEKIIIVTAISRYFEKMPSSFKVYLRDAKIKNILGE